MTCHQYQFLAKQMVDDVVKFCRQMNFMRCFDCGHVIEKKAGCNHITCVCGAHFCYLCGTKWGECKCQVIGEMARHQRRNVGTHRCPHCAQAMDSAEELRVHISVCQAAQAAQGQ